MSFPPGLSSPSLTLLILVSDCCISDVKPLTLPNENCPVFLPFLLPCVLQKSQRAPHQLVLSRSLCSDVNQTLVSASVIIGCNCTVCLIHRLWGFICMVISPISESKNLIASVSCFVHVIKMKRVCLLCLWSWKYGQIPFIFLCGNVDVLSLFPKVLKGSITCSYQKRWRNLR